VCSIAAGAGRPLDDLIRPCQKRWRIVKPERFRRLEVDQQIEVRRLLNGKVGRLGSVEGPIDVAAGASPSHEEAQKEPHLLLPCAIASDPALHPRELDLGHILPSVSNDPGGAIPFFIAEVPVRPVSHASCAAARKLSASLEVDDEHLTVESYQRSR
jgi:hypothetical protein